MADHLSANDPGLGPCPLLGEQKKDEMAGWKPRTIHQAPGHWREQMGSAARNPTDTERSNSCPESHQSSVFVSGCACGA